MEKEINIEGKNIFYRVYGEGEPVMLVHGFGETGDVWRPPQTPAPLNPPKGGTLPNSQGQLIDDSLLNRYRIIIPDLPGSGKSEMIEDMSMEGMAEILKTILDKEIKGSLKKENSKLPESSKVPPSGGFRGAGSRVILIGHSMGGYITLAFAEKYEDYLRGFGLFHSTAYPDTEEKKATRRKGIEFIKEHGALEFLQTTTPNLFSSITKQRSPELVSQFIASLEGFSADALVSYYESMINRPDRTSVLQHAKVPVLFIMGEYDNAVPMQDVLKQCYLPAVSSIHILHESGHMGMLEETAKSTHALEEYFSLFDEK